jgi:hypothetical protein
MTLMMSDVVTGRSPMRSRQIVTTKRRAFSRGSPSRAFAIVAHGSAAPSQTMLLDLGEDLRNHDMPAAEVDAVLVAMGATFRERLLAGLLPPAGNA